MRGRMKNIAVCLICLMLLFQFNCAKGKENNQQKTSIASSQKNIGKHVLTSDSVVNFPAKTICNKEKCSTFVALKNGTRIFAGEYPKEPFCQLATSNLLQLTISCGSPCNYTSYINLTKGIQSKSYFMVLAIDTLHEWVAFCDTSDIKISSIFDSIGTPISIKRNYSPSATMSTVVDSASFTNTMKFVFHYYTGKDFAGVWDSVEVKFQ
jgi:hypothetical protein